MLGIVGRARAKWQTLQRPADCTAAMSQSAFDQSEADRKILDRECCHSHLVAFLGEGSGSAVLVLA